MIGKGSPSGKLTATKASARHNSDHMLSVACSFVCFRFRPRRVDGKGRRGISFAVTLKVLNIADSQLAWDSKEACAVCALHEPGAISCIFVSGSIFRWLKPVVNQLYLEPKVLKQYSFLILIHFFLTPLGVWAVPCSSATLGRPLSVTGCCGYKQDPWRNLPPQPHFSFIHIAKLDSSVTAESVGAGTPYSRPELPTQNIAVLILAAARLMSVLPFSGRLSADAYGKDLSGKDVG
ncbi:unnamed protein product [Caenorhabditis auriculariae]|uniref:Uncharacterized protein n=1 Tax=Caenorhabditis auriculariae TaxID=2777116 RepID=A0A8S1HKH3_9PELO|nr:unnamed protein product [Caenorhabditis auriculariae]